MAQFLSITSPTFYSYLFCRPLQYHISKVSQSEPQTPSSSAAMDDLESALQSLEVKMEGESSSAAEMLVRHTGCAHFLQIVCHKLCKMFLCCYQSIVNKAHSNYY